MKIKLALIQNNATHDEESTCKRVFHYLQEAVSKGATWILLPEMFHFRRQQSNVSISKHSIDSDFIRSFQSFAKKYQVSLLLGSFCESIQDSEKVFNTSLFIDHTGDIIGVYRKIHLFDAVVNGVSVKESDTYQYGNHPTVVSWGDVSVGLSICYDLRFPELYRHYMLKGSKILCVPASFTYNTGAKHWIPLLRARAIENQCFVVAPNQVGIGAGGLKTYGHSVCISPEGTVLVEGNDQDECVLISELDFSQLEELRSVFPCLKHHHFNDLEIYS